MAESKRSPLAVTPPETDHFPNAARGLDAAEALGPALQEEARVLVARALERPRGLQGDAPGRALDGGLDARMRARRTFSIVG